MAADVNKLDQHLLPPQKALLVAFGALIRQQLAEATQYSMWCESVSYREVTRVSAFGVIKQGIMPCDVLLHGQNGVPAWHLPQLKIQLASCRDMSRCILITLILVMERRPSSFSIILLELAGSCRFCIIREDHFS